MSDLQSIVDTLNAVEALLPKSSLGNDRVETITGQVSSQHALDRKALQVCLDQFKAIGGWLQYQGHVVRPQDFAFSDGITAEHPKWGVLLDAELFSASDRPASLAIRFDGAHWQASQWQPGEGETWLAETVPYRGLGGTRQTYLRLWRDNDYKELRPVAAWLVGNDEQGKTGN